MGTHDSVPNKGVRVVKVVEYFEGVIERNEIGVSGEVDEPACCIGV